MKQFTVRGLSGETEKKIEKVAREKGISVNRAIVSLIEREAGGGKMGVKGARHDLDNLFGVWSRGEAAEFDRHLEMQRKVDERLWKTNV